MPEFVSVVMHLAMIYASQKYLRTSAFQSLAKGPITVVCRHENFSLASLDLAPFPRIALSPDLDAQAALPQILISSAARISSR